MRGGKPSSQVRVKERNRSRRAIVAKRGEKKLATDISASTKHEPRIKPTCIAPSMLGCENVRAARENIAPIHHSIERSLTLPETRRSPLERRTVQLPCGAVLR